VPKPDRNQTGSNLIEIGTEETPAESKSGKTWQGPRQDGKKAAQNRNQAMQQMESITGCESGAPKSVGPNRLGQRPGLASSGLNHAASFEGMDPKQAGVGDKETARITVIAIDDDPAQRKMKRLRARWRAKALRCRHFDTVFAKLGKFRLKRPLDSAWTH